MDQVKRVGTYVVSGTEAADGCDNVLGGVTLQVGDPLGDDVESPDESLGVLEFPISISSPPFYCLIETLHCSSDAKMRVTYGAVTARNLGLLRAGPALAEIRVVDICIKEVEAELELVDGLAYGLPAAVAVVAALQHLGQLEDELGLLGEAVEPVAHKVLGELVVLLRAVPGRVLGGPVLGRGLLLKVLVVRVLGQVLGGKGCGGQTGQGECEETHIDQVFLLLFEVPFFFSRTRETNV